MLPRPAGSFSPRRVVFISCQPSEKNTYNNDHTHKHRPKTHQPTPPCVLVFGQRCWSSFFAGFALGFNLFVVQDVGRTSRPGTQGPDLEDLFFPGGSLMSRACSSQVSQVTEMRSRSRSCKTLTPKTKEEVKDQEVWTWVRLDDRRALIRWQESCL